MGQIVLFSISLRPSAIGDGSKRKKRLLVRVLFVWVNMGLDQRGKYMKSVGFLDQDNRQSVKAGRSEVMQGCGQTGNFRVSSLAGGEFPREAIQAWPQWGQLNLCNVFKNHIMDNIFDSHPETRKNENLHV